MRTEQNVNYRGLMALVEEVAQTEAALERVRLIVHAMAKRSGVRVPDCEPSRRLPKAVLKLDPHS
jgi:hypothetical protein